MAKTRPLWQILIATIPHRDTMLRTLLTELDSQITALPEPLVEVAVVRDNLEFSYGDKMAFLFATATAKYISVIDDDDWISPRYVGACLEALAEDPDFVGYPVQWQVDGKNHMLIDHSVKHGRWITAFGVEGQDDYIVRDISEKNPVRRTIAMWGHWEGGYGADQRWADRVRERVQEERAKGHPSLDTEIYLPEPMYYYRYRTDAHFQVSRQPVPFRPDPLPEYPWLTVHDVGPTFHPGDWAGRARLFTLAEQLAETYG